MEHQLRQEQMISYLERIGACLPAKRDAESLDQLILQHLYCVPFENIDIIDYDLVPDLDIDRLYEKIVLRRRGGYCFELNMLFGCLLQTLGYSVYPVGVRVMWNREQIPPMSHMGLVTEWNGRFYYCDVGFGGPGPKGLLCLKPSEQEIGGEQFRVRVACGGDYLIERKSSPSPGDSAVSSEVPWKPVLRFQNQPFQEADFQLMNFYCAKNKAVLFARSRVVNLCIPGGSKALTDEELVIREKGGLRRMIYQDRKELEHGLLKEFGIRVSLP